MLTLCSWKLLKHSKQVERDRKWKATDEVKTKKKAYRVSNDNSTQACTDYSRFDGGPNAREVHTDVSDEYLQGMMMDYYHANVRVTSAKALEIESVTKQQSTGDKAASNVWMAERRKRITASTCGPITRPKSTTKVGKHIKSLLYTCCKGNAVTQWRDIQEPVVEAEYIRQKCVTSPDITVSKSGFVVHHVYNWLGASPDGLVNDPSSVSSNHDGIVQYKNPYSVRELCLQDASLQKKDFCLVQKNGILHLKHIPLFLPSSSHNVLYWTELV